MSQAGLGSVRVSVAAVLRALDVVRRDRETLMKSTWWSRPLTSLLIVSFLTAQVPRSAWAGPSTIETGQVAETYNFEESVPLVRGNASETAKVGSSRARKLPVSSSGTFTRTVPIQVPPGRDGMTPSLALNYSSGGSKSDSEVGAGWSFSGFGMMTRSLKHGFPPVKRWTSAVHYMPGVGFPYGPQHGNPIYDDDATIFEGPAGELARVTDGPSDANLVYAPVREGSAARYEYLPGPPSTIIKPNDGSKSGWIEHDPSGTKRYYGVDPSTGREARIRNELGAHSWLLLAEVDVHGNTIEYQYNDIDDQNRDAAIGLDQYAPVLSRIEWGGNRTTGQSHAFFLKTTVSDRAAPVRDGCIGDALHGHVALCTKIDRIDVGLIQQGQDRVAWSYKLNYDQSKETGRLLLSSVQRLATGEDTETESFGYTHNPDGHPVWDRQGQPLEQLRSLYSEQAEFQQGQFNYSGETMIWRAVNPQGFRAGSKFLDLDGNGEVDIVYHPAGLSTTAAALSADATRLQTNGSWSPPAIGNPGGFALPWTSFALPDNPLGTTIERERFDPVVSDLADVDGDGDLDAMLFPFQAYGQAYDHPNILWATGIGLGIWANSAKPSQLDTMSLPTLEQWPDQAVQQIMVKRIEQLANDHRTGVPKAYVQIIPVSDFYAPFQDVNGDGKADLLLTKTRDFWGGIAIDVKPGSGIAAGHMPMNGRSVGAGLGRFQSLADPPGQRSGGPDGASLYRDDARDFAEAMKDPALPPPGVMHGTADAITDYANLLTPTDAKNVTRFTRDELLDLPDVPLTSEPTEKDLIDLFGPPDACQYECPDGAATCRWTCTDAPVSKSPLSGGMSPMTPMSLMGGPTPFGPGGPSGPVGPTPLPGIGSPVFPIPPTLPGGATWPGHTTAPPKEKPNPENDHGPFRNFPNWFPGGPKWFPPWMAGSGGSGGVSGNAGGQYSPSPLLSVFDPRVYIAKTDPSFKFDVEMGHDATTQSAFGESLRDILNNGRIKPCGNSIQCIYPKEISFNAFYQDVNADGLVDLVVANVPGIRKLDRNGTTYYLRPCNPGHTVYINRGYRFEPQPRAGGYTWSGQAWSDDGAGINGPLSILRNRDRKCASLQNNGIQVSDEGEEQLDPFGVDPDWGRQLPMTAMAPVDINADGRVDMLFASDDTKSGLQIRLFLNTPKGWHYVADAAGYLPPVPLAVGPTIHRHGVGQFVWPDMARYVDLDNDGLVDVVQSGKCDAVKLGNIIAQKEDCPIAPRFYRNISVIPDVLNAVSSSKGTWTNITYKPAVGTQSAGTVQGTNEARPGQLVASYIENGSRLNNQVERINLSYANFARDHESTESIGFERVTADFANSDGTHVIVMRTFAVEPDQTLDDGSASPVRYALKGAVLSTLTTSGQSTSKETTTYTLTSLPGGEAVRIRPRTQLSESCEAGQCATAGAEISEWDSEAGEPMTITSGDFSDGHFANDALVVRTTYAPNARARLWRLGLPTSKTETGTSADIGGNALSGAVLSSRTWIRYPNGDLKEEHIALGTSSCAAAANESVHAITYDEFGLPKTVAHVGKKTITVDYDAAHLYPQQESTTVTHYVEGQGVGSTTLTVHNEWDYRHGLSTRVTDSNGITTGTTYDTRGRATASTGPGGVLLETTTFKDSFPASATSTIYTGTGATSYQRKVHVDPFGRSFAIVEGLGTSDVPFVRTQFTWFDAWGRPFQKRLPHLAASLDDYEVPSDARLERTSYDGFDRLTRRERADGAITTLQWVTPRTEVETNPRGHGTARRFDWRGAMVFVSRWSDVNSPTPSVVEMHQMTRDSRGELLSVVDGDGNVRRIERDLGGRLRKLELPHKPAASTTPFTFCHDQDSSPIETHSPEGRTATTQRDELGRPVVTTVVDATGTVSAFSSYDDPSAPNGKGRLTALHDASGTYAHDYDGFGRLRALHFAPASNALGGLPGMPASMSALFDYDIRGNLQNVTFPDLASTPFSVSYDRDAKGRPIRVSSLAGASVSSLFNQVRYDAAEHMTDAAFGNGTFARWDYAPLSVDRLDTIHYFDAHGEQFGAVHYDYDPNENIREETRWNRGSSVVSHKIHTFDALDRIKTSSLWTPRGNKDETFVLSPAGNITSVASQDSGGDYQYEDPALPQAVTHVTSGTTQRALTYNRDGELVREQRSGATLEERTFTYNAAGCVTHIAAHGARSASETDFVCELDGRTVARRTRDLLTGTVSTRVDFAGLIELQPEKGIALLRVPVNGTVGVEVARSLWTGEIVPSESSYIHSDVRSSVLATTSFSAPGDVRTHDVEYDAWGQTYAMSELAAPTHQYVNHEPDPGLGYYHFGPRIYDPSLRRWLSPDPLFLLQPSRCEANGQECNLYAYARLNPVNFTDPRGTQSVGVGPSVAPILDPKEWAMRIILFVAKGFGSTWSDSKLKETATEPPRTETYPGTPPADNKSGNTQVFVRMPFCGCGPANQDPRVFNKPDEQSAPDARETSDTAKNQNQGTSGGDRAGKGFTPKGKKEIDAENAARNGGTNVCENCDQPVVPGQQSKKGVTPPGNERQRDHMIPKSAGGDGDPSNGQVLCRDCNLKKSNKQ